MARSGDSATFSRKLSRLGGSGSYQRLPTTRVKLTRELPPHCIPEELLTFEPTREQTHKCFFKDTPKEVHIRQLFACLPLSDDEQLWLREWRAMCSKEGFDTPSEIEPFLLRVLYYNKRKFKEFYLEKAYEHVHLMISWRQTFFPMNDDESELRHDLDAGVMYWCGRDRHFRPLLVIRLKRLPRNATPERFKRLTVMCFEFALRYLFLPGKVETCSALLDVRGVPMHALPVSSLTDMTTTLTKQYPFRLDRMYILNDSIFIQTVWRVAKQFLTEVQQQKMQFYRTGFAEALLKEFALHQLEKSFGGSRPELTNFYPFPLAPGPYALGSKGPHRNAKKDCIRAVDEVTQRSSVWEGDNRETLLWAPAAAEVFTSLGLPPPRIPARYELRKRRLSRAPTDEKDKKPKGDLREDQAGEVSETKGVEAMADEALVTKVSGTITEAAEEEPERGIASVAEVGEEPPQRTSTDVTKGEAASGVFLEESQGEEMQFSQDEQVPKAVGQDTAREEGLIEEPDTGRSVLLVPVSAVPFPHPPLGSMTRTAVPGESQTEVAPNQMTGNSTASLKRDESVASASVAGGASAALSASEMRQLTGRVRSVGGEAAVDGEAASEPIIEETLESAKKKKVWRCGCTVM